MQKLKKPKKFSKILQRDSDLGIYDFSCFWYKFLRTNFGLKQGQIFMYCVLSSRFLENEIHKTNLKLMEGETIKKKYHTILDMLKKERLTFGNQLEGLEAQLKKQDEEIVKLKATHASAIATRDLARQNQHRREIALLSEGIFQYNDKEILF